MTDARELFSCLGCGVDTAKIGELYAVHDAVWLSAMPSKEGMLCVRCLEQRLGRKLCADDFRNAVINDLRVGAKSELLISRITAPRTAR